MVGKSVGTEIQGRPKSSQAQCFGASTRFRYQVAPQGGSLADPASRTGQALWALPDPAPPAFLLAVSRTCPSLSCPRSPACRAESRAPAPCASYLSPSHCCSVPGSKAAFTECLQRGPGQIPQHFWERRRAVGTVTRESELTRAPHQVRVPGGGCAASTSGEPVTRAVVEWV